MKLIIKNDIGNQNYQKNPNIKIINTDSASFDNLVYHIEKNDIPVIKFTDENSFYMINSLHERYTYSNSEVYIKVSKSELENIGTALPTFLTNRWKKEQLSGFTYIINIDNNELSYYELYFVKDDRSKDFSDPNFEVTNNSITINSGFPLDGVVCFYRKIEL